jgi:hypothetical protein
VGAVTLKVHFTKRFTGQNVRKYFGFCTFVCSVRFVLVVGLVLHPFDDEEDDDEDK